MIAMQSRRCHNVGQARGGWVRFRRAARGASPWMLEWRGQRMAYTDLIYSVEDSIATTTLNRPTRLNALSPNLEEELHRAFDEADEDRAVRVIILTGAGQGFCAGFDQGPN